MVMANPYYKPQPTTIQNVALIPNYFSSGEEDNSMNQVGYGYSQATASKQPFHGANPYDPVYMRGGKMGQPGLGVDYYESDQVPYMNYQRNKGFNPMPGRYQKFHTNRRPRGYYQDQYYEENGVYRGMEEGCEDYDGKFIQTDHRPQQTHSRKKKHSKKSKSRPKHTKKQDYD